MTSGTKLILTDEQKHDIALYGTEGCTDATIAALLNIPGDTLHSHKEAQQILVKSRAQYKRSIRTAQAKHVKTTPVMAIFLGKNALGQADKSEVRLGVDAETASLLSLVDGSSKGKLPSDE